MPQIFHRSANYLSRASIIGAVVLIGLLGFALWEITLSPWYTDQEVAKQQPVPFSHRHHAGELGIDCRYCHTSVEKSSFAGIPPTQTCMTCHSQIWTNAEMLEPVRASYRTDQSPRMDARQCAARFRLFRPQHSRGEGRRMHDVPRSDCGDAADLSGRYALYVVVPGMPSPARKIRSPQIGSFQSLL
jgi:hypothetical protein